MINKFEPTPTKQNDILVHLILKIHEKTYDPLNIETGEKSLRHVNFEYEIQFKIYLIPGDENEGHVMI